MYCYQHFSHVTIDLCGGLGICVDRRVLIDVIFSVVWDRIE